MKIAVLALWVGFIGAIAARPLAAQGTERIAVKFVVVTDLDVAAKRGRPGVFQAWVSGEHFGQTFHSPGVDHAIAGDGQGSLAVLVGSGGAAGLQLMALAADPRFDFSQAYWLLTGVGFANPDQLSIGSVAWGTAVVDGDIAYEVDRQDAPGDWPYGVVPLDGSNMPIDYPAPPPGKAGSVLTTLNYGLAKLGFTLSKDLKLADLPGMQKYRTTFAGYNGAIRPPTILSGAVVGTTRTWHGKVLNQWATDWTQFWLSADPFLIGDTSDQSAVAAPNQAKDDSLAANFAGFDLAAANVFLAGRPIFHEITGHWDRYAHEAPEDYRRPEKPHRNKRGAVEPDGDVSGSAAR